MKNLNKLRCITCNFEVDKSSMNSINKKLYWCENCRTFVKTHIDKRDVQVLVWNEIYENINFMLESKLIKHISINKDSVLIEFFERIPIHRRPFLLNVSKIEMRCEFQILLYNPEYIGLIKMSDDILVGRQTDFKIGKYLRPLLIYWMLIDWSELMVQKCPKCNSDCFLIDIIRNDQKWYKCRSCSYSFFIK